MDNPKIKHDRWMLRYRNRISTSFEEYTEIINTNNTMLEKINTGDVCVKNRSYEEAIKVLSSSIDIGKRLFSDDNLIDESELAKAYMNRGVAYEFLKDSEKALDDKTKSVVMLEKLSSNNYLDDENILAYAYMNRGATYESMGEYDKAVADAEKSIAIWDRMKLEGIEYNLSDYVETLKNISIAKTKNNTTFSAAPYRKIKF